MNDPAVLDAAQAYTDARKRYVRAQRELAEARQHLKATQTTYGVAKRRATCTNHCVTGVCDVCGAGANP